MVGGIFRILEGVSYNSAVFTNFLPPPMRLEGGVVLQYFKGSGFSYSSQTTGLTRS